MTSPLNNRGVRGIRDPIPQGTILGRTDKKDGPAHHVKVKTNLTITKAGGLAAVAPEVANPSVLRFRLVAGTPGIKPASGQELFNAIMLTGDKLFASTDANFKCFIKCEVATTADWTITFKNNSSTVGTAKILAAGTSGTFTISAEVDFADGDLFTAICPTQDATLSGISVLITGPRL